MEKTYKVKLSNCCDAPAVTDDFDCDICSKCGEHAVMEYPIEIDSEIEVIC